MAVLERSAGFQVKKSSVLSSSRLSWWESFQSWLRAVFVASDLCHKNKTSLKRSHRLRETREGWPLQNIETEANGDSRSTNERGPSLVGLFGLTCRWKRFLAAPVRPVQSIFFSSPYTMSIHLSPLPSKLHRQAVVLGSLSLSMCLWFFLRVANHEDSIAWHASIQPFGRSSFWVELADSNSDPAIINTYKRASAILEQKM